MTKQRKVLLDFFENRHDETFSTQEIVKLLSEQKISQSAVYRNLAELEKAKKVRRHTKVGTNESYYQFISEKKCANKLHLNCSNCSSIFHLNTKHAEIFVDNLLCSDGFEVDTSMTIIYGICKKCKTIDNPDANI